MIHGGYAYFNLLICSLITLAFNVRFMSTGLYRKWGCCEYAEMLVVPAINPTLQRAAVTLSYRLSPRRLYTLKTKFCPHSVLLIRMVRWIESSSPEHHYLLTYFMEQSHSWEVNRFAASQEIPAIYGTRMFITTFTSACHLSLSWASSIQSIHPHPTSWRFITWTPSKDWTL
jgi:hypothetical protein